MYIVANNLIMERKCIECGSKLLGRIDQKFCSDYCRTSFNNQKNRDVSKVVRNTNNCLKRNRKILKNLIVNKYETINRAVMVQFGFDFRFFTGRDLDKNGQERFYIYDLAYSFLSDEEILIQESRNQILNVMTDLLE